MITKKQRVRNAIYVAQQSGAISGLLQETPCRINGKPINAGIVASAPMPKQARALVKGKHMK